MILGTQILEKLVTIQLGKLLVRLVRLPQHFIILTKLNIKINNSYILPKAFIS